MCSRGWLKLHLRHHPLPELLSRAFFVHKGWSPGNTGLTHVLELKSWGEEQAPRCSQTSTQESHSRVGTQRKEHLN